jgi:hypothetical protein
VLNAIVAYTFLSRDRLIAHDININFIMNVDYNRNETYTRLMCVVVGCSSRWSLKSS